MLPAKQIRFGLLGLIPIRRGSASGSGIWIATPFQLRCRAGTKSAMILAEDTVSQLASVPLPF
jgi:hypothetical protein